MVAAFSFEGTASEEVQRAEAQPSHRFGKREARMNEGWVIQGVNATMVELLVPLSAPAHWEVFEKVGCVMEAEYSFD